MVQNGIAQLFLTSAEWNSEVPELRSFKVHSVFSLFGTEFRAFSIPRNRQNSDGMNQNFRLFRVSRNNFFLRKLKLYPKPIPPNPDNYSITIFRLFSSFVSVSFAFYFLSLSLLPFIYLDGDLSVPNTPIPRKSPGRKPNQENAQNLCQKVIYAVFVAFPLKFSNHTYSLCMPGLNKKVLPVALKLETYARETEKLI
jgi:hypothetical protein